MIVNRLIALDMPASSTFANHVKLAWEANDAVFPIDQRLPQSAKDSLIAQFKPSQVIDEFGNTVNLRNSEPVSTNDALVIATSGSTGSPKGVVHTHNSIRALLNMSQARLHTNSSTHWLLCLPVSHVAGFSVLARSIIFGNPISILPKFDESDVLAAVEAGATHVSLVPTALRRIKPTLFDLILLGGATAPADLSANVITTYGMTETFGGVAYNGQPLDGVDIRITNGQIDVRSPSLFRSYRCTDASPTTDGWYRTGDSGQLTHSVLHVFGRTDDMIITGGENVWPHPVEKIISTIPGVDQVVVRGIPDEQWGQRVVAWIASSGADAPTLEDVRQHVKRALPSFCAPSELRIVKDIPTTSLGKIDIQTLRKMK
jgi:O-succinylbenzoic acid--CoA ligase